MNIIGIIMSIIFLFIVIMLPFVVICLAIKLVLTITNMVKRLFGKSYRSYGGTRLNHNRYYGSIYGCQQNLGINDISMQANRQFMQQINDETNRQFMEKINDEANRQFMQQMQEDSDTAMKMATGMEFGGYNCDPNLNPGMDFANDMSFSNDMGTFGGMGFW